MPPGKKFPKKLMARHAICFVCFKEIPYVAPTLRRHRKESGLSIVVMQDGTGVRKDICDPCLKVMRREMGLKDTRKSRQERAGGLNSPSPMVSGGEGEENGGNRKP